MGVCSPESSLRVAGGAVNGGAAYGHGRLGECERKNSGASEDIRAEESTS